MGSGSSVPLSMRMRKLTGKLWSLRNRNCLTLILAYRDGRVHGKLRCKIEGHRSATCFARHVGINSSQNTQLNYLTVSRELRAPSFGCTMQDLRNPFAMVAAFACDCGERTTLRTRWMYAIFPKGRRFAMTSAKSRLSTRRRSQLQ